MPPAPPMSVGEDETRRRLRAPDLVIGHPCLSPQSLREHGGFLADATVHAEGRALLQLEMHAEATTARRERRSAPRFCRLRRAPRRPCPVSHNVVCAGARAAAIPAARPAPLWLLGRAAAAPARRYAAMILRSASSMSAGLPMRVCWLDCHSVSAKPGRGWLLWTLRGATARRRAEVHRMYPSSQKQGLSEIAKPRGCQGRRCGRQGGHGAPSNAASLGVVGKGPPRPQVFFEDDCASLCQQGHAEDAGTPLYFWCRVHLRRSGACLGSNSANTPDLPPPVLGCARLVAESILKLFVLGARPAPGVGVPGAGATQINA